MSNQDIELMRRGYSRVKVELGIERAYRLVKFFIGNRRSKAVYL